MSGLEALGLACNILQLVSLGQKVIRTAKDVYQNGIGSSSQDLVDRTVSLNQVLSDIPLSASDASRRLSSHEAKLFSLAQQCRDIVGEIQRRVPSAGSEQPGLVKTLKLTARALRNEKRLADLEKKLQSVERTLQTGLLAQIFDENQNVQVDLASLDSNMRHFISEWREGRRGIDNLISKESQTTRAAVVKETADIQGSLRDFQAARARDAERQRLEAERQRLEAQRQRLLRSLKFPGMNERRNQASVSQKDTFKWIFNDPKVGSGAAGEPTRIRDSFSDWLESDGPVFWVSGKPGAGKTTLMKHMQNSPATKEHLKKWRPGAAMLSHYIWRLGTAMQQNIKGLLCSLLYQALDFDESIFDAIVAKVGHTSQFDSDTDWSVEMLKSTLLEVALPSWKTPVCIFIDGLDEVDPKDGISELFSIINRLKRLEGVKLCLSSRAEPPIRKRLQEFPFIRLQDLTFRDIRSYTRNTLIKSNNIDGAERKILVEKISDKAEGVFLWVVLVVKALNRGLDNGDTYNDVKQRIDQLPADISDLYQDMWNRLNEDNTTYQEKGAFYLSVALFCTSRELDKPEGPSAKMWEMTLASTDMPRQIPGPNQSYLMPTDELLLHCEETKRSIETRSAGLLEVKQSKYRGKKRLHFLLWDGQRKDGLWECFMQTIEFVHRTARDFLWDTHRGQEILRLCPFPSYQVELKLIEAQIWAVYGFWWRKSIGVVLQEGREVLNPEYHSVFYMLKKILHASVRNAENLKQRDAEIVRLTEMTRKLCENSRMFWYSNDTCYYRNITEENFHCLTAFVGIRPPIQDLLKRSEISKSLISRMLSYAASSTSICHGHAICADLLESGADPTLKLDRVPPYEITEPYKIRSYFDTHSTAIQRITIQILGATSEDIVQSGLAPIEQIIRHGSGTSDDLDLQFDIIGRWWEELGNVYSYHLVARSIDFLPTLLSTIRGRFPELVIPDSLLSLEKSVQDLPSYASSLDKSWLYNREVCPVWRLDYCRRNSWRWKDDNRIPRYLIREPDDEPSDLEKAARADALTEIYPWRLVPRGDTFDLARLALKLAFDPEHKTQYKRDYPLKKPVEEIWKRGTEDTFHPLCHDYEFITLRPPVDESYVKSFDILSSPEEMEQETPSNPKYLSFPLW